jgi:glyoxylase-like metal-dependent hydrolase (beta-lactamase superfamily II)
VIAGPECEPATALVATLADAGIHRILVPGPFKTAPTNAYLLDDDPLTLVDPGANWVTSLEALTDGLAALGRTIDDLGMVVVTHQHIDHEGLAGYLARQSGAEVVCLDLLAPYLASFAASIATDYRVRDEVMRAHGIGSELVECSSAGSFLVQQFGAAAEPTRTVADGDLLELRDRRLRFHFRPGHSPSDTVIIDEQRAIALAGDHLLPDTTSNALVDRSLLPGAALARTKALLSYRESLCATGELEIEIALPGHGAPISDVRSLIDERFAAHDQRAERLLSTLVGEGPSSAHGLALAIWGDTCLAQPFLTLSETLGHLDLLVERGLVIEDASGDVTTFELAR